MTGRSPARLLAPLALVVCAVALFAVVSSGGGDASEDTAGSPRLDATPTATAKPKDDEKPKTSGETYTVKAGDTPSGIAEQLEIPVAELLDANPDADPNALSPGQKLKLP